MRLRDYDGQCVRLTDADGTVFEGVCSYNSAEYNEDAYGRPEEGLEIVNFLFFKSGIREIQSLENCSGPYGRFSSAYGSIEELNAQDGIESIRDVLFSEENEHVLRMLKCLESYWIDPDKRAWLNREEIAEALQELAESHSDVRIQAEAARLLDQWR